MMDVEGMPIPCWPGRHAALQPAAPTRVLWALPPVVPEDAPQHKGLEDRTLPAPAGAAQWTGHWPENQSIAGSVPRQGTDLRCRPGPQ